MLHLLPLREVSRDLRQEPGVIIEAEARGARLLWSLLPRAGTSPREKGARTSLINQENDPQVPSLMTVSFAKLTKQHRRLTRMTMVS